MEDGLVISVLSLLKNVKEELNITVLTMSLTTQEKTFFPISEHTIGVLDTHMKKKNVKNAIRLFDITDIFQKELPHANMDTRFTPYCMLRLYVDQIPNMPNRILYLDSDVVCRRDCSEFYHQEMQQHEFAGVLDHYGKWFFRRKLFHRDYLNSGVLLLNLKRMEETGLLLKCRKMCRDKKMFMPDQSALNKLSASKKICKRKYNEQRKLHKDTVLQHFTTSFRFFPWVHTVTIKPWQPERLHSELRIFEYDDILGEYATMKTQLH